MTYEEATTYEFSVHNTPDMIRWQSLRGELLAGRTVQLSLTEGHNGFLKVNYVTFL